MASKENQVLPLLQKINDEMDRRLKILKAAHCNKIQLYKKRGGDMPYIVLAIDEFAEIKRGKKIQEEVNDKVERLASMGRAPGISLILATQHPKTDVIPSSIRNLIDSRLCFKVADGQASRVALGEHTSAAAYLPEIKGRAIFKYGNSEHFVQTMLLEYEDAEQLPCEVLREDEPESKITRMQARRKAM